jgi:hypothetical protein
MQSLLLFTDLKDNPIFDGIIFFGAIPINGLGNFGKEIGSQNKFYILICNFDS